MQQKTDDLPADDETPRTVDVFLNFPTLGAGGQIQGVYPSKRFSALIVQVNGLDADKKGLAKLVRIVGIIDAVLTLIEESGLGTDVKFGSRGDACLGERRIKKNGNATGELARLEAGLVRFRSDRNCLIHAYLWKDNDDNSWRAMLDRNQSFLNELTGYFFEGRPTDTPGQIAFRFPQLYGLPPATMRLTHIDVHFGAKGGLCLFGPALQGRPTNADAVRRLNMSREDATALLAQAEERYHLKIFENISESTVKGHPLPRRLRAVGKAVMERTDYAGYVLGRRLLAAADELDGRC